MSSFRVCSAGPGVTVQDLGREGHIADGLSRGGAADRLALLEGAALLGNRPDCAALEMAGFGGVFEASDDVYIALTGAPMAASVDGRTLIWNASHHLSAGDNLTIGAAQSGVYGYLHVAGGLLTQVCLGSRSTHLTAAIGAPVAQDDRLPYSGDGDATRSDQKISPGTRFAGGMVRVLPSAQTELFAPDDRARFESTEFTRDTRGNRQGVRLVHDGTPFATKDQLSLLSEVVMPGDIQMTGDGTPFVLLPECQTTGGYPRIGTVHPDDLAIVAQAAPGTRLRFRFVTLDEALDGVQSTKAKLAGIKRSTVPLVRDPRHIHDLLRYQLISGVTCGRHDL